MPLQDERNQVLTSYLWVRQAWLDAHLAWDKDAYGGIDSIRIPSSYVWRPDIVLYNKWVMLTPTRGTQGGSAGWGETSGPGAGRPGSCHLCRGNSMGTTQGTWLGQHGVL